jgi:hypothetical protein
MIGGGQRPGAIAHALFEAYGRIVELLVENDVIECHRQPAAEHLDQRPVGGRQRPRGLQQHDDLAPAAGFHVEHGKLGLKVVGVPREGVVDGVT